MWNDYTDVVRALEELIELESANGDRLFALGICTFIVICFSIFRRKEHI